MRFMKQGALLQPGAIALIFAAIVSAVSTSTADIIVANAQVATLTKEAGPFPPGTIIRPSVLAVLGGMPGAPLPFPAQSFTPAIIGDGSGSVSRSGPITLNSFSLGTQNWGKAVVFRDRYRGTFQQLKDLALDDHDAANLLGTSTSVMAGTYSFEGLILPDVNAEVFVYLDVRADPAFNATFLIPLPISSVEDAYEIGEAFAADEPILMNPHYLAGKSIPIFCEPDWLFSATLTVLGDVNQDGIVNLLDVAPFVELLLNGEFQIEADINQDGAVDQLDVQPFVDLLTA